MSVNGMLSTGFVSWC